MEITIPLSMCLYHLTVDLGTLGLLGAVGTGGVRVYCSAGVRRTHSGLWLQQIKLSSLGICYLKKPQSRKSKKEREPTHGAAENRDPQPPQLGDR